MMELFLIYKYAFILCVLAACLLAFQGTHLVARKQGLQVLALSQAAVCGHLLGLVLAPGQEIGSLFGSILLLILFKSLMMSLSDRNESFFIVLYLALTALSYLLISMFPMLDSHLAYSLFGDVVSISARDSIILSVFFISLMVASMISSKQLDRTTLNMSLIGTAKIRFSEEAFFALGLISSLYGLGLLFTVSYLVFPVVMIGNRFKNQRRALLAMMIVSSISSVLGLSLSLWNDKLGTVPTQIMVLLFCLFIIRIFFKPGFFFERRKCYPKS